jgi:MFS transporter, PAT family, beta-lactamase induction signal transducer AmpG
VADQPTPRYLAPPFWAILTLPFGLTVGFASIAVPFVLRARGVDMTLIATVSQVSQLPHIVKPFWSPALDSGPRRRTWYFATIALTAVALAATALIPPSMTEHLGPLPMIGVYTAVLLVAQAAVATSASAVLALMAVTVPDSVRGRASGWQTAGNLVGMSAGGGLVAWMIGHASTTTTAIVLASICAVCAIPAAFIEEIPPPRRSAWRLIVELGQEIGRVLRSRDGWTGMLICLSPVGTGSLTNLFGALAKDYAPDDAGAERLVVIVTGILGGIVNAGGSLAGGYIVDRVNRRLAYVVFGGITALSAVAMMIAAATPTAFTVGCLAYTFANGLCYAAFYAFLLDLLGKTRGVTTQLALYVGASNTAITYVTWFDGASYDWAKKLAPDSNWAPRAGMLGMDALATFAGIGLLWVMLVYVRRAKARDDARAAASPATA